MLYIDVTQTCQSPMNTGVQRIVRGMVKALQARTPIQPLAWCPWTWSYTSLSEQQQDNLYRPFEHHHQPSAHPERMKVSFWQRLQAALRIVDLEAHAEPQDWLLIPEIFTDSRVVQLPHKRMRKAGVFYDLFSLKHPQWTPARRRSNFEEYLRALSALDCVFAISEASRQDLVSYWTKHSLPTPPVVVNPLALHETERPKPFPCESFEVRLLCVASLEPRKNHHALLQAVEALWLKGYEFKLILIGREVGEEGAKVVRHIEQLKAQGRPIEWLMHINDEQLQREYRDSLFTVFPSLEEGFGLPVLESLWHHRPCICGDGGGLKEIVEGGGCMVIDVSKSEAIAEGIRTLLESHSVYRRLCSDAAERKFRTWQQYTDELLHHLA